MTARERRQAELLESYRDMLARDPAAIPPPALDPEIAAMARLLARHPAPAPGAAFTAALRRQLLALASREKMARPRARASAFIARARRAAPLHERSTPRAACPRPRAGRRPRSALLTAVNGLTSAALIAALTVGLVLLLRGHGAGGNGGSGGAAVSSTGTAPASICPPSLLPVKPATPPATPIPATPTGREAALFVACTFEQDPGLRRAEEAGLVQHLDASQTVDGFTLTVERVYADAGRVVIGYTIRAAEWITAVHRLDRSPSGGLTLTDSAGRTYRQNLQFPVSYGGFGPERLAAYVAGFDTPPLPPDRREETFALDVAQGPITSVRSLREQPQPTPAVTTVYNAEGTPTGQQVRVAPSGAGPEQVGVAGPWRLTFTVPIARGRTAEVNQTVTSAVTASYRRGAAETAVPRCAACPGAPAAGVAITLERVIVTPGEARVYLRFAAPDLGPRGGEWEVHGIGIEDPASPPQPRQGERQRQPDGGYVVSFTNPLYGKPGGEWTLHIDELFTVIPPDIDDHSGQGGVIVRLAGQWTYRFTMP
jgi:hypothetical protein